MKRLLLMVLVVLGVAWTFESGEEPLTRLENEQTATVPFEASEGPLLTILHGNDRIKHGDDIEVDYSKTLEQRVAEAQYKEVDKRVSSANFPTKKTKKETVEITILQVNRTAPLEDLKVELGRIGFRTATAHELVGLRTTYPGLRFDNPMLIFESYSSGGKSGYPWCVLNAKKQALGVSEVVDRQAKVEGGTLILAVEN
jgi:hypothetical protein